MSINNSMNCITLHPHRELAVLIVYCRSSCVTSVRTVTHYARLCVHTRLCSYPVRTRTLYSCPICGSSCYHRAFVMCLMFVFRSCRRYSTVTRRRLFTVTWRQRTCCWMLRWSSKSPTLVLVMSSPPAISWTHSAAAPPTPRRSSSRVRHG